MYYVFDLLNLDGKDLTSLPLMARKDRLEKLVRRLDHPQIRYGEHYRGVGEDLMHASCSHNLEGVVSKRVDAPYVSGRHDVWVKSKCIQRQEFVIGGYSDGEGARLGFGALLLGVFDGSKLRYVGRCGTGFNAKQLTGLAATLRKIQTKESPYDLKSPRGRDIHWVRPELVAEIKFAEWTADKHLRAPVFIALRTDKPAREIVEEKPRRVPAKKAPVTSSPEASPAPASTRTAKRSFARPPERETSLKITHPEKIIYPKEKLTKLDVAEYYDTVTKWILPHVADRPLSLVRCPQGASKPCFYSKHFADDLPEGVIAIPQTGKDKAGEKPFVAIDSPTGLRAVVQRSSLEIHPWGCHRNDIERPDQIVMDFDPDVGHDFELVKEGALELREILTALKIKSFLKVTGGKGLHVQFPFEPLYGWDQVKEFARTLALEMVARFPKAYTANIAKKARKGKIFIDYLRNGRGATAVAPYSLRARTLSAVAMPIFWDDLEALPRADVFTLNTALQHLKARKADPWKGYLSTRQKISILKEK